MHQNDESNHFTSYAATLLEFSPLDVASKMRVSLSQSLAAVLAAWTVTASVLETTESVHARTSSDGPIVDLGYATYQGSYSDEFNLNVWKGQVAAHLIYP